MFANLPKITKLLQFGQISNKMGAFQIYAFLLPHPALSEGEGDKFKFEMHPIKFC
jgi:hypothetical protein